MKKIFEQMDKNIEKLTLSADKVISHKMPTLKPCPFCGVEPVLLPGDMVQCMTYKCPMHPDYVMTVEQWNARKENKK